jgi:hypothetical protein
LFNGARSLGVDDRFVFFNLGNILRQPCSAAASFCVFSLIDQIMQDPSLRAVPKGLIADEVWALVQDPFAAAILERSLKAYRSLGAFALPIVQDPRDLDTPAGRVILVNTATKVILPMDRSGQDEISRYVRLNERELDLVRDLRLVKRRYSEFFVSIEGVHSAKGLVIPDPLRYAISTTDPSDEAELDRLYRQTGDMLHAVSQFAREMPYGIGARAPRLAPSGGQARWLVLASILAAAVLTAVALLLARPGARSMPAATSNAQIADRERAAEQAARLLTAPPASVDPDRVAPPEPRPPAGVSHGSAPASDPTIKTIEELQALARSWSAVPQRARGDSAPPMETRPASARTPSAAPFTPTARERAAIPDRIENASSTSDSDPLQGMSLQTTVVTASPTLFPWTLLETRPGQNPPQARLAENGTSIATDGAWFEPGDSPIPGWMLVNVETDFATVMSSHGNLVELPVAGLRGNSMTDRSEH